MTKGEWTVENIELEGDDMNPLGWFRIVEVQEELEQCVREEALVPADEQDYDWIWRQNESCRLMVQAAPELLNACVHALDHLKRLCQALGEFTDEADVELWNELEYAINKATNGSIGASTTTSHTDS